MQAHFKTARFKFLPTYVKLVDARRGSRAEIIKRTSKCLKVNVLAQIQCFRDWESAQKTP